MSQNDNQWATPILSLLVILLIVIDIALYKFAYEDHGYGTLGVAVLVGPILHLLVWLSCLGILWWLRREKHLTKPRLLLGGAVPPIVFFVFEMAVFSLDAAGC